MEQHKNLFNQLKITNGISDSYVEYIELFLRKIESENYTDNDIKEMTKNFGIYVNNYSPKEIKKSIRYYYIYMVNQQVDLFYENASNFFKYCKPISARKDYQPKLNYLYKEFVNKDLEDDPDLLICDYYRLVRNQYTHKGKKIDELLKTQNKIISLLNNNLLNLPNNFNPNFDYNNISFDDFIMYSYAFKKTAEKISNSIIESYDADRIAIEIGDRYKGRNNNPEKIKKMTRNFIKIKLYCTDESLVETVVEKILKKY